MMHEILEMSKEENGNVEGRKRKCRRKKTEMSIEDPKMSNDEVEMSMDESSFDIFVSNVGR
jgi:hypothetical protein